MILLFGWKGNEWTERAKKVLEENGWNYKFVRADSCTGREYNEQAVKIIPTVRITLRIGGFINFEGLDSIEFFFSDTEEKDAVVVEAKYLG